MHTSVALERKDFASFNVQEGLHIGTMVKDFRAIVAHAESMRAQVTARYSRGNRPMQISYEDNGVLAEFTLMTRGTTNVPHATSTSTPARDLSLRPLSRPPDSPATESASTLPASSRPPDAASMPPPARTSFRDRDAAPPTLSKTASGDSAPLPAGSLNTESMFIPADDDDHQWGEPNFEEEPDIVTWDNTADEVSASSSRHIRDSELHSFASMQDQDRRSTMTRSRFPQEIAPTQRLSQVRGIFD